MKSSIWFSVGLHLLILAATTLSSPFVTKSMFNFDEVIRVTTVSVDQIPGLAPPEIPDFVFEEDPEIPIDDPTTKPAAKIDKPKPKPEKKSTNSSNRETEDEAEPEETTTEVEAGSSKFGQVTVDNSNFDYPIWFRQAFVKIARNFRHSIQSDGSLVATVYFQVLASGRITGMRLEQSSGYADFDNAALEAVSRSAPFPPLPRDFRDEILGITIPFTNR